MDEKHTTNVVPIEEIPEDVARNFTHNDQRDMKRMGKKQELLRSFKLVTSVAFTSCVMGTWEILLTSSAPALISGGLASLWWQMIWCYIGQSFIVVSLSEMASMAPTAGGQYHWVSEFAPPSLQKVLSYTSGWLSTLAWQAFVATDSYIIGALVQALIVLNNPGYEPQRWQTTLLMIAFVCGMGAFNVVFARSLAVIEGFFAVLHFVSWIAVVGVLWAMTPVLQSPKAVFTDFSDNGANWSSIGLAICAGQIGGMFTVVGSDSSAHMAEETRDAGVVVPRSIIWSFVCNILPTMVVLPTYLFCIGDLDKTLNSATGYAVVSVFQQSTGSVGGATGLTILLLILLIIISTSCMAATVRQTFAFARDNGMVFSSWLAHVSPRFRVPINTVIFTAAFTVIMSLINIGSTAAFNAFLSVSVVALMATYSLSIACILLKRLRGEPLPPARWRLFGKNAAPGDTSGGLGRVAGPVVNVVGLVYSLWAFFWGFWPLFNHPTPETMNWAVVIFAGVMIIAGVAFVVHARKVYHGPVSKVQKLEDATLSQ